MFIFDENGKIVENWEGYCSVRFMSEFKIFTSLISSSKGMLLGGISFLKVSGSLDLGKVAHFVPVLLRKVNGSKPGRKIAGFFI